MAALDPKFLDVSGSDSDPDTDTTMDAYGACSSSSTSKSSSVPSLLSTFRTPKPSDLARKRKVACNSAPGGGKRHKV